MLERADFTVAELKTLRVRHRLQTPLREHFAENFYQIVTLEELFAFVQQRNKDLGTSAGVHIEIKNTPFFAALGLRFEERLIELLVKYGYEIYDSVKAKQTTILVQSFDVGILKSLRSAFGVQLRMGQLVDRPGKPLEEDGNKEYSSMLTAEGLDEIAKYADSVNPMKNYFYEQDQEFISKLDSSILRGKTLCDEAHKRGLALHTWTVRSRLEDALQRQYFNSSAYDGTQECPAPPAPRKDQFSC
jgi:glycerophosphoryl diester phosphodiesterase